MKHLKLFFALFAMLALGVGNAWGETTISFGYSKWDGVTANFSGTAKDEVTQTVDGVKVTYTRNGSSLYANTSAIRFYKSNTLKFDAPTGYSIQSIAFTCTSYQTDITSNVGTCSATPSKLSWSGDAISVTFTRPSTASSYATITGATVTLLATGGGEDPGEGGGENPDSGEETSATMTAGTNGSACTVNGKDGIKVGSSSKGGDMQITVPAGATMLHVYAAAWKGVTGLSLNITPTSNVTTTSIALTADVGIANSTPFTLSGDEADYLFDIPLQNITAETTLTFESSIAKRFVVWGATYETASGDAQEPVIVKTLKSIAVSGQKTTFEQGDIFKFDGICTATYSVTKDGVALADETAEVTPASVSTPDMNTVGTQTVFVTYSEGGVEKTAEYTITITENTVTAGTYCTGKLGYAFWGLSAEKTTATANEVDYTRMFNDITINIKNGAKANAYFKEDHTRVYSGGYTMTFTAPVDYVITAISFTPDAGNNWAGTHTANVGTMTDSKNWTGSANEVTITFGGTCRITDICVSYEAAPVEPVKTLTSIEITTPATQTTFWQGETFNYDDLVVTAHYSDAEDEIITPTVTGSTATAGTATVTVSYKEQSTSYAITVNAIPNTKETAYTVADAFDIIDKLTTADGVFIKGIVSQVDEYFPTYKSITYWISADGTTTKQLQVYSGKGLEGADFSGKTDLSVGDQVIVCGNLKKYSGTYEFDKNNYLASHTPTTKDPAGLAYATTSYTANVGQAFTTPELTNPHNLVVTYSTSDASKATVDANTGAVTIVAAGVVTITAATTGDATHDAGSASYNITISDPSLAVAQLPFTYNSGKADIETTAGITQEGLGSDYSAAPKLKFDHTGDNIVIRFGSQADELSYDIKGNPGQGTFSCTFAVQESEDGSTYTDLVTYTTLETTTTNKTHKLAPASRYVKFVFTEKSNGNVALGNISITKPDLRAEAGIAWNPATVSLTVGDAFTAPTFNNPNGLSGITFASSNEALATVNNAGAITLINGKTGTATITATFADGHADYKPAEATCVITVSPKSEKVVILAQYGDQWYALKAAYLSGKTDRLDAIPVNYVGGKLYNVAEADKASIEWSSVVEGDKVSFLNDGKYLKGKTSTTLLFEEDADGLYQWDNTTYTMTIGTTVRSFLYNGEAFRNFAVSNAGKVVNDVLYSSLPVVTAPVYATGNPTYTRTVTPGNYGTICLPYASSSHTGAEFYEVSWLKKSGETPVNLYLDQLADGNQLVAGKPYIFRATSTELTVTYTGEAVSAPVEGVNGLTGSFDAIPAGGVLTDNYVIAQNKFWTATAEASAPANRAYINATMVPTTEPAKVPGRRRVSLGAAGENAETGIDNIITTDTPVKVIENGQLIIIRNGEKFNVQGQKL